MEPTAAYAILGPGQNDLQLPEVGSIIPWDRRAP
jgi:hypothetical protein